MIVVWARAAVNCCSVGTFCGETSGLVLSRRMSAVGLGNCLQDVERRWLGVTARPAPVSAAFTARLPFPPSTRPLCANRPRLPLAPCVQTPLVYHSPLVCKHRSSTTRPLCANTARLPLAPCVQTPLVYHSPLMCKHRSSTTRSLCANRDRLPLAPCVQTEIVYLSPLVCKHRSSTTRPLCANTVLPFSPSSRPLCANTALPFSPSSRPLCANTCLLYTSPSPRDFG